MSSYSAPERLSGSFNSRRHPKKVVATDHTHTSLGVGDVKKAADNAFTGDNSFSGETIFTNENPVSLMINSGTSTLHFKQSTLDSDPAGSIEFRTADNTNGDLKISAHTLKLKNSAGTDPVILTGDKITTTVLPECSASVSTANQLVNKTYADTKVSKTGDETVGGVKTFTSVPNCSTAATSSDQLVNKTYADTKVSKTGDETVAGQKRFSSNIGIGTTSPVQLLHLSNDSGDTIFHMTCRDSGSSANDGFSIVHAADNHLYFNQRENANMMFYTNNTERMRIIGNGYVGIGTAGDPSYPLHVTSSKVQSFSNLYYFSQGSNNSIVTQSDSFHTSIYASASIVGGLIGAHSDRRIKKDIIEINDDTALQQIRLLKPCKYKYKDPFSRNNEFGEIIGFIAQEVKEAIPLAVKQDTGDIPNIMIMGSAAIDASNNHILTIPDFDTSSLEVDASGNVFTKLKILINEDGNSKELYVSIQEVVSATELKVEMLDNEATELPSEVFIYGQEVDNKSILVKDRIFSVGMSALQEIDRQQQAEKAKIATLEQSLALLQERISALENPTT